MPAGSRSGNAVNFLHTAINTAMTAPFIVPFVKIVHPTRVGGWSNNWLMNQPNMAARDAADLLINGYSTEYLTAYFAALRQEQADRPGFDGSRCIVVRLAFGVNDTSGTYASQLSLGGRALPSNTPGGHLDNLQAAIRRIRQVWAANGWPAEELYFHVHSTHKNQANGADDVNLAAMRLAQKSLPIFEPNCCVSDDAKLATAAEMVTYYDDSANQAGRNHLNQTGYQTLELRRLDAYLAEAERQSVERGARRAIGSGVV